MAMNMALRLKRQRQPMMSEIHELEEDSGLLQTLSEDLQRVAWDRISEYVSDANDYISLMNSSSWLRSLLEERRAKTFFPSVLKLIVPYITEKELNDLRLVSKSWKRTVDLLYLDSPTGVSVRQMRTQLDGGEEDDFNDGFSLQQGVFITNVRKMSVILTEIEKNRISRCPIVGGRLTFLCKDDNLDRFWKYAIQFLQVVGKWVRHLHIQFYSMESLVGCLVQLPNIESICFEPVPLLELIDPTDLKRHVIPYMPNLKHLSARQDVDDAVLYAIMKLHASNLVYINLDRYRSMRNSLGLKLVGITNLTCELTTEGLKLLARTAPPITSLNLTVIPSLLHYFQKVPFKRVFEYLEAFGSTLTHLSIRCRPEEYDGLVHYRMNFACLKVLELRYFEGPLDPLLSLKKLHRLIMSNYSYSRKYKSGSIVSLYWINGEPATNLYDLVPSLTRVIVT